MRPSGIRRVRPTLVLWMAAAAGCGRISFDPQERPNPDAATDAGEPGVDAAACPFQPARNVAEVNSPSSESGGMMSDDRLELYFSSTRGGGASDLYVARRTDPGVAFAAPTRIDALSTVASEDDAFIERDGLALWFQRDSSMMRSIRATRDDPWPPATVVVELDTVDDDGAPGLSADGLTIYFSSTRPPTVGGSGLYDLFRATRAGPRVAFGTPVRETIASSAAFDCCPHVLPGGTQVAFTTRRSGVFEVYVADRMVDGSLGPAELFSLVDSPDPVTDFDVFSTPDGSAIGVASDRPGGLGGSDLWLYERRCE